jgi:Fe-S oxidoreductase
VAGDPRAPATSPVALDDARWERVTQITGGATAACFQCGVCTASCPWNLVRDQPMNVREMVRRAQLGVDGLDGELWLCTTCSQCVALCPRGVDVPQVFRSLRAEAWRAATEPETLAAVLWNVHQDGNPWGQPPSQRMAWAEGLNLPAFDAARHDVLVYVGCSACYDGRLQKVARSLVEVLRAAGVAFGVLGEDEPCCGESVLGLGNQDYFREVAGRNSERFSDAGVATLVALSPHCADVFAQHCGAGEQFRPLHYTQYLADLLAQDRLPALAAESMALTYHDPCYLGRTRGVYEEPRELLSAVEGIELREMENNREQALCCGGGGGRLWFDTPLDERFAPLRIAEAEATGATVIATACPACLSCLEDGVRTTGGRLAVMDVVEVLALGVRGDTG